MIECGLAGKIDDGRAHAEALLPVVQSLFVEPNPAVFKGVLHAQGRIPTADVRLPLVNASDEAVAARARRDRRRFVQSPTEDRARLGGRPSDGRAPAFEIPKRLRCGMVGCRPALVVECVKGPRQHESLRTGAGARVQPALADPRASCASACW